jgi:hypothetical protein
MNPNFIKSQADKNGIRNEYLKNLQLETSNNLMNYNANQIFKQSGVLPPSITALVDTRSITEKYADKQKARVAVIAGLREITDGANANQIIDQIQGNDIIDLLNNLPQIIAEIKPKWSLGITAPAFLSYWDKYKQALSLNAGVSTIPIIQSNQILTNIQGLLQNLQTTIATKEQYDALGKIFDELTPTTQLLMAKKMNSRIRELSQSLIEEAKKADAINDPIVKQNRIAMLGEIASLFPTQSETQTLINEAQIAQQLDNTPTMSNLLGTNSLSIQQPAVDMLDSLSQEQNEIESEGEGESTPATPATTMASESTQEQTGRNPKPFEPKLRPPTTMEEFQKLPLLDKRAFIVYIKRNDKEFLKKIDLSQMNPKTKKVESIIFDPKNSQNPNYYTNTNIMELLTDFFNSKGELKVTTATKGIPNTYENVLRNYYKSHPSQKIGLKSVLAGEEPLEPTAEQIAQGGKETGTGVRKVGRPRIMGRGVATAVAVYTKKPKVDTSHKVERVPSYIEFGKHLLHQHNLLGGILQIRRRSGNIINELPRQSIGGRLKKILITLTGTGSPSFEDINELSTHEKELLNKVVKHCKIDQRLLVPTPDKTKEEQDMNRLQILSGEITAGNNNPTIVKELKTLLLRLKNSGRIPRREAHEIMEDLLTLGY